MPSHPLDPAVQAKLKRLGKNVKLARVEADFAQDELAREAGTTRAHVSGVERGLVNISAATTFKLAAALGVPPSRLFEGIE